MARIRTVKPEFWASEQVMNLTPLARLVFIGLWNFCDDGGNHPASARTLKAEVLPGDDIGASEVEALVSELLAQGLLVIYEAGGKSFWHVTGWHHQRIDKPSVKHPPFRDPSNAGCSLIDDTSSTPRVVVIEDSPNALRGLGDASTPEGKGGEGRGREGDSSVPYGTGADGADEPVKKAAKAEKAAERRSAKAARMAEWGKRARDRVAIAAQCDEGVENRAKDEVAAIWDGAKAHFWVASNMDRDASGSHIGGLITTYGEAVVMDAAIAMCREQPAAPSGWLKRACQLRAGEASKTNKQGRLEAGNLAAAYAFINGGDAPENAQTALEAANAAAAAEFLAQG